MRRFFKRKSAPTATPTEDVDSTDTVTKATPVTEPLEKQGASQTANTSLDTAKRQVTFRSPLQSREALDDARLPGTLDVGQRPPLVGGQDRSASAPVGSQNKSVSPSPPLAQSQSALGHVPSSPQLSTMRVASEPARSRSAFPTIHNTAGSNPSSNLDSGYRSVSPTSIMSNTSFHRTYSRFQAPYHDDTSQSTFVRQPITWAEQTFGDLVANLGDRERTRQEVLWEMVHSEERYVRDLASVVECYVDPLLYPEKSQTPSTDGATSLSIAFSHSSEASTHRTSPDLSLDHLPIATRFARSTDMRVQSPERSPTGLGIDLDPRRTDRLDASTSSTLQDSLGKHHKSQPFTSPHYSNENQRSASSLGYPGSVRHHLKPAASPPHKLHKFRSAKTEAAHPAIPEDLRILLETIGDALLGRHEALSIALKDRWEAQYPLVRSLSSVWNNQNWIVHDYSNYVLHLEKGLAAVERVLGLVHPLKSKANKSGHLSEQERDERRLAKLVMKLEERAAVRGESSLAICLSKPFQRLLKYPLLFQNLLYHTDATTAEYEATRQLAVGIDRVVKSIENDKVSEEELEKVRDLWARIEGVKDKMLMSPRSDRYLLEEQSLRQPSHAKRSVSDAARAGRMGKDEEAYMSDTAVSKVPKSQKTVRRLSDMMSGNDKGKKPPAFASKRDIWLVRLSDVVIRCQRTGVTSVPIGGLELPSLDKDQTKQRRAPARKRNLYKFLDVERWESVEGRTAQAGSKTEQLDARAMTPFDTDDEQPPSRSVSFTYANDDPRPVEGSDYEPRIFYATPTTSTTGTMGSSTTSSKALVPSRLTQTAASRRGSSTAKFGNRLRTSEPTGVRAFSPTRQPRAYEQPTQTHLSKARRPTSPNNTFSSRAPTPANKRPQSPSTTANPLPVSSATPGHIPRTTDSISTGMMLFDAFWAQDGQTA